MQVVFAGSEIIVDEDGIRLFVSRELRDHLTGMAHAVRHSQTFRGEITEATTIVTSSSRNEAGGGKKVSPREDCTPRSGVVRVVTVIIREVPLLQAACFHVAQDLCP